MKKGKVKSLKEEAIKKCRAAATLRKPTPPKDAIMDELKITKVIREPRIPPRITILKGMKPYSVVEQLQNTQATISIRELLTISEYRKKVAEAVTPKRKSQDITVANIDSEEEDFEATEEEEEVDFTPQEEDSEAEEEEESQITSLTAPVKIEGVNIQALIDTGAACSAISHKLLKKIGFKIDRPARYRIKGIKGNTIIPLGELENCPVNIGGVTVNIDIAVLDASNDYDLILGNNLLSKTEATI